MENYEDLEIFIHSFYEKIANYLQYYSSRIRIFKFEIHFYYFVKPWPMLYGCILGASFSVLLKMMENQKGTIKKLKIL